jgi:peptidoglycan hydrolase FlgJ
MNLISQIAPGPLPLLHATQSPQPPKETGNAAEVRQAFDSFVGETFYGQLLGSMRKTQGKPAYFHGGRAEEIFQGQLDQMLSQEMTKAGVDRFSGPMFELFNLKRS